MPNVLIAYWRKKLCRWLFAAGMCFFAVSVGAVFALRFFPPPTTAFILGYRIENVLGANRPNPLQRWTDMEDQCEALALAVIAAEDQKFFQHRGFDFEAIKRAWANNRRPGTIRGASTISQQTAKNLFLWPGRDWVRKGMEAYFTLLIEWILPKKRILEIYLNIAEFGDGIYGAAAASERFFSKPPHRLSASEAARLAAVLPNPKQFDAARPTFYLKQREAWILRQMRQIGDIQALLQDESPKKP